MKIITPMKRKLSSEYFFAANTRLEKSRSNLIETLQDLSYWHEVDRTVAELILNKQPIGTFLLRPSSINGSISFSQVEAYEKERVFAKVDRNCSGAILLPPAKKRKIRHSTEDNIEDTKVAPKTEVIHTNFVVFENDHKRIRLKVNNLKDENPKTYSLQTLDNLLRSIGDPLDRNSVQYDDINDLSI